MSQTEISPGSSASHPQTQGEPLALTGAFTLLSNPGIQLSLFEVFEAFIPVVSDRLQTLHPHMTSLPIPDEYLAPEPERNRHTPASSVIRQVS